jgi:TfoX/Sxy family transcriptional regulator of competence genes
MNDGLVVHILDMLRDWGGISARRMFSGYGLFRQGAMFGLISRDTLYLRVDDRNRPDFVAARSRVFRYSRGPSREIEIRGYMDCPPDILEYAEAMLRWANAAASAAPAAKSAKPTRKRRRAAKPHRPQPSSGSGAGYSRAGNPHAARRGRLQVAT